MFLLGFRPLDVVSIPTKHFSGFFNKKKKTKFLGVDPLGYEKRGGCGHPTTVGDAPAPDILCISLLVNSGIVPSFNKGQYREIEINIGRVNNSDIKLSPVSGRWAQNRPWQGFCWGKREVAELMPGLARVA